MGDSFSLVVNGVPQTVADDGATPLLAVLRNTLDLKGSRYGCGLEQCGACMVLVDGNPAYSCTLAVEAAAGKLITTIEGLGTPEAPHPIQTAFIELQAGQCGYCLSGMMIEAKALLDTNPNPTRAEIVGALDKHLCRCGAHLRIIKAVQRAAEIMRQGPMAGAGGAQR
jgi:nicotinate dehydrogenase subunit A